MFGHEGSAVSEVGVVRVEGIDEMSAVKVVPMGLEKVSPVKGESVSVERVSVGMLVRGGTPVGAMIN